LWRSVSSSRSSRTAHTLESLFNIGFISEEKAGTIIYVVEISVDMFNSRNGRLIQSEEYEKAVGIFEEAAA